MVGPGRNPTRRSRKIGTAAQGVKRRNAFGIPDRGETRFYEALVNPIEIRQNLSQHEFTILVEPPFEGFTYHASVQDVIEVLKLVPEADRKGIKVIAFRQPKRKERIFSAVWGRMAYWATFGKHKGVSIVIEATEHDYRYKAGKHVGPVFARELAALKADGHSVTTGTRTIEISCPPEAIRNTQLFRTLLHEIGHHVDYEQKVERPSGDDVSTWLALRDLYFARPQSEREQFADRYAAEASARFRDIGAIPFSPRHNDPAWGLKPEWFWFGEGRD